jgi:hypothetical protein
MILLKNIHSSVDQQINEIQISFSLQLQPYSAL